MTGFTTILASGRGFWMPVQASTVAAGIDWVFDVITWISIFFFVLIVALMGVFMWKYRRSVHKTDPTAPSHHTPLEITWTVIPLILVIAIFYIGMRGFMNLRQAPAGTYDVYVTAQKWSWSFSHRNGAQGTELHMPAGQPVKLIMQSTDVLHSLYIPAFRVKRDVVPGRMNTMWFEVPNWEGTEPKVYDLFCTEYCGTDHSRMITKVKVYPQAVWEDHIEKEAGIVDRLADDQLACYARERLFNRCSSCHSLDGTDGTGPSFKGLWERTVAGETVFTDGSVLKDLMGPGKDYEGPEDYLMQSIVNPGKHIKMNFTNAMPTFQGQLRPREVSALIEFIKDPYAVVDEQGRDTVDCSF